MASLIELHNVRPFFRKELDCSQSPSQVWETELSLRKGESLMVKASSGSGKTTFCSFISGMRMDYDGEICIDGRNIRNMSSDELLFVRRHSISTLFQDLMLFDDLNAIENVTVKASLDSSFGKEKIGEMLFELGLDDKQQRRPVSTLSLGQKQRVAFVRMLCCRADFRILDEPISHLDQEMALKMSAMLRESQQRDGAGVIVTSVGNDFEYSYERILRL